MIKITLSGDHLTLIDICLSRRLIPIPTPGDILTGESTTSGLLSCYVDEEYYGKLFNVLKMKCESGEFIRSNAEAMWTSLLSAIAKGKYEHIETKEKYKEYFHISMFME